MPANDPRDPSTNTDLWNPQAPGAALFDAVEHGDTAAVQDLLADGADINAPDPRSTFFDGQTALISAANSGLGDMVRLLLSAGADVNVRSTSGWTALMRACNADRLDCARVLLDAGAEVGIRNDEGYSALGRTRAANKELIRLLTDRGAD
ncbi:ankyrin repeat domain-containing protein [Streptomyces sp. NPDC048483]|uniref:ankyrin repeat domain-containing protein n=1 Tax=Streptomyces sp. NPDC048483 TaxID=3154927 RepID=UPI003445107D